MVETNNKRQKTALKNVYLLIEPLKTKTGRVPFVHEKEL